MSTPYDDLSRPPLNAGELTRALTADGSRWCRVEVVESLPSTNAALADLAREGAPEGLVLVAEHQSAGRGRLDRTWVSPPRAGITMSALIRPRGVAAPQWPWVTLLTGLAVAAALRSIAEVPAVLKWPNDVLLGDRKVAGLLAERVEAPAGFAVVMGIGLNVTSTRGELPVDGATSLRLEDAAVTDRATLLKAILRRFDGLLGEWEATSGEPSARLRSAYEAACSSLGGDVVVHRPGREPVSGRGVAIDRSGRLVVQTEAGRQAFGAGDVVHVRDARHARREGGPDGDLGQAPLAR